MKINNTARAPSHIQSDLFIIPLDPEVLRSKNKNSAKGASLFSCLDRRAKGKISEILKRRNFGPKGDPVIFIDTLDNPQCKGLLCINFPANEDRGLLKGLAFQSMGRQIVKTVNEHRLSSLVLDASAHCFEEDALIEAVLEGIYLASYKFEEYKSASKEKFPFSGIKSLTILRRRALPNEAIERIRSINEGVAAARNLCNMPACDCTPSYFSNFAKNLAHTHGLQIKLLSQKELQRMGAMGILSVAQGSREKPVLIQLHYRPRVKASKVIALVGKGVTFDSGGICIKPSAGMEEMKHDMAGAAAAIGAMKAIAQLQPDIHVRAYIPVTENVVDGHSTKPGDIIKALNGKTIEVVNTDAEGRLILADAIALAERDGCDEIIDLATLTGAAVVALGMDCAALYSPLDDLAAELLNAAAAAREYLWRMPLIEEYKEQLKSSVADIKNIGDKSMGGGSISGALFLQEFVEKSRWAHLDIAGPALRTSIGKEGMPGSSGYGVRTLVNYVLSQVETQLPGKLSPGKKN